VALDQSALLEVLDALKAAEVDDRVRQAAQTIYQALIEAELTQVIGAGPHQRAPERLAQRNGHRPRLLATTAGDLELRIPKLRAGSFFPSLLERRRRVDQALFAVVMEAYMAGSHPAPLAADQPCSSRLASKPIGPITTTRVAPQGSRTRHIATGEHPLVHALVAGHHPLG
jgi:hypothetical protein